MNYIVIGPQGSGKSTQAELLAKQLGVPHVEVGNLLYYLAQEKSPQGQEIKKAMETGVLVDDELTLKVIERQLKEKQYQKGVVLDGFPRTLFTAKRFKLEIDKVFYLKVSDEKNIKRLVKRSRKDDTPELIKKRLAIYHQETEPVLDYYRQRGILEEVDGERPIDQIYQDIMGRVSYDSD